MDYFPGLATSFPVALNPLLSPQDPQPSHRLSLATPMAPPPHPPNYHHLTPLGFFSALRFSSVHIHWLLGVYNHASEPKDHQICF